MRDELSEQYSNRRESVYSSIRNFIKECYDTYTQYIEGMDKGGLLQYLGG